METLEKLARENPRKKRLINFIQKNLPSLPKKSMCLTWLAIGDWIPGDGQQIIKQASGIKDNRFTYASLTFSYLCNVCKAYGMYWLAKNTNSTFTEILNNGLALYFVMGTTEAIARTAYTLKTGKPIAQLSVEAGWKGFRETYNLIKKK